MRVPARVATWPTRSMSSSPNGRPIGSAVVALRAAQHARDAREQLHQRERLGHVVVGAELEAAHAIELRAARRKHDHRHPARRAFARADPPADLEAIEIGSITSSTTRS